MLMLDRPNDTDSLTANLSGEPGDPDPNRCTDPLNCTGGILPLTPTPTATSTATSTAMSTATEPVPARGPAARGLARSQRNRARRRRAGR